MTKRVLTGAIYAILVLAGIYLQGWAMLALLGFGMLVATGEMYHAFRAAGTRPVCWTGYLFCAASIAIEAANLYATGDWAVLTLPALMLCAMLAMAQMVLRGKVDMEGMAASLLPLMYPGVFFVMLMQLLSAGSRAVVMVILVLAFFSASINDVFALFCGMLFGRHKLSPELSPKKTIEGSIGGMLFCVAFSVAVPPLLKMIFSHDAIFIAQLSALPPLWSFGILGLVAGAFSQIGDLSASMIKRRCGIKDYGKLLPGHGGIMDRMDGVLFCGAVCLIFLRVTGLD